MLLLCRYISLTTFLPKELISTNAATTSTTQPAPATTPGQAPATAPPGQTPKATALEEDHPDGVKNTIMDLHLELLFMFHRVCLKLAQTRAPPGRKKSGKGSDKGSAGLGGRATITKQKTVREKDGWRIKTRQM